MVANALQATADAQEAKVEVIARLDRYGRALVWLSDERTAIETLVRRHWPAGTEHTEAARLVG